MKKPLLLALLALPLAGCPVDGFISPPATAAAAPAGTPLNLSTFLTRLEAARGSALSVTEKAAVGGAMQQTRSLIDAGQQRFLGVIAQASGMDVGTLGVLYPPASQPLSQADAVGKIEAKLGRHLGGTEAQAIKAATQLRNNSLATLKGSLAGRVGSQLGLPREVVESLFPLAGL